MRCSSAVLVLSLAGCMRLASSTELSEATDDSSSDADTTETTDSGSDVDPGDDTNPAACASEFDCGVGERCEDGWCTCDGNCACDPPWPSIPGTDDARAEADDAPLSRWDIQPAECFQQADCGPLEFCDDYTCVETTACTDHPDCVEQWGDMRFCIDGLCRPDGCESWNEQPDTDCLDGSLCVDYDCRWLTTLPACAVSPTFDEVAVVTLEQSANDQVVAIDLDGDGRDDLVTLSGANLDLHTSLGTEFAVESWPGDPGDPRISIAAGDVDGDGQPELLVGHGGAFGIEVVSLQSPELAGFVPTMYAPSEAITFDLDVDGLPDLVTRAPIDSEDQWLEGQLGGGTGEFAPLWIVEDPLFAFGFRYPEHDAGFTCARVLTAVEPEFLAGELFHYQGGGTNEMRLLYRPTVDHFVHDPSPARARGLVATTTVLARGALSYDNFTEDDIHIEIPPNPGATVFVHDRPTPTIAHAFVDHGPALGSFVEFDGPTPTCAGLLEQSFDAVDLGVGDFDGDGREDILVHGNDGAVSVWLSRN